MYAVIDCNNFYVSCERVFCPKLEKLPVVVLSNNDGCIISRSNEIKDLGVNMGAPIFQYAELLKNNNVHVFSSNFSLYADLSSRIMRIISQYSPSMEIYSVDEVFIEFEGYTSEQIYKQCKTIKDVVMRSVGIPVSIGIGKTKTLAKAANEIAKKVSKHKGIFGIGEEYCGEVSVDSVLERINVENIWGIGRRLKETLNKNNIFSSRQLKYCNDEWVRSTMSKSVLRTVLELRGEPCIDFEDIPSPKKSIVSSRSFGKSVKTKTELREALAKYASRVGEKLREEKEVASHITILITTNYYSKIERFYTNTATCSLEQPTSYTPDLIKMAHSMLDKIYKEGYLYKKAAVLVTGLVDEKSIQHNLFKSDQSTSKEIQLMKIIDSVNKNYGSDSIHFASQGFNPRWAGNSMKRSPRYTTRWDELITIQI